MARTVSNPKLDSRNARLPLKRRREPYWQVIVQGCAIGYRKNAVGGTWIARWRTPEAKHIYHAIGPADDNTDDGATSIDYKAAQDAARKWFAEMEKTLGKRGDYTVGQAIDDYISFLKRERSPAAAYDSEKRAGKWIKPKLGKIIIHTLKRDTLNEWWASLLEPDSRGKVMTRDSCNHVLTVLKAALNRAAELRQDDVPSVDAWVRLKPYKDAGSSRKVVLNEQQRTRLINTTSGGLRDLILGALLTGARPPGELAAIRAQDFDPDTGTVTIVKGKTGSREATLDKLALKFFEGLAAGKDPDALLFTKDDGEPWGKNHHIRPWKDAAKRAKLPKDATIYALRHTHISQRLKNRINIHLLADELGTSVRMIEKHYAKYLKEERRDALNASSFMKEIPGTNVQPMRRAKA